MKFRIEIKKNRGAVLAYTLVIISITMILLVAIMQFTVSRIEYAKYREIHEQSLQIAESGIYFYRWYLAHEVEGKTTQQIKDFWENGNPLGVETPYERDLSDIDGTVRGRYRITVTPPEAYSTIVLVETEGWTFRNPDIKRKIQVRFRRPSWSDLAVLGNAYMRFGNGTTVMGPLHVNGGVHFDGVAYNVVSSSVEQYYDNDSDVKGWHDGVWTSWANEYNTSMGESVFSGGNEYPVAEKSFANVFTDLSIIKSTAQNTGTYFGNNGQGRHIILNNNKTFSVRTVATYNTSTNAIATYSGNWSTLALPDDGVIFVEDNIWLEGKINGNRLTIAAADLVGSVKPSIFIGKDILYTSYDGRDILGIIAQNNIEIVFGSKDVLRLDGALLAQNGRVGRSYYPGDQKSTITVFGSLASNTRYGFGYTDGTGYAIRNLFYDNNLLYYPPPYFPTGNAYSIDLWKEI
ncbi:MAG: hypothetical protein IPN70_03900 [Candidatus Moraniibacteriota bacterium]|nr:MAG: hypothetical protein IPN70_03900 [Candidatus Moranbacteria bacterium]